MIFLRPWLLLLIFVPILLRLFRRHTGYRTPWEKVIDKRLLPYLLTGNNTVSTRRRSWYELLVWTLISVAAAGPAWNKTTVPTRTQQPGTVIIAELSPAMTGENLIHGKPFDTGHRYYSRPCSRFGSHYSTGNRGTCRRRIQASRHVVPKCRIEHR